MRFSSSVITMLRRSAPIMTLSFASSNSSMATRRLPLRAAFNAASLPGKLLGHPLSLRSFVDIARKRTLMLILLITLFQMSGQFSITVYMAALVQKVAKDPDGPQRDEARTERAIAWRCSGVMVRAGLHHPRAIGERRCPTQVRPLPATPSPSAPIAAMAATGRRNR